MRIIISPAKKMKVDSDALGHRQLPVFVNEQQEVVKQLQSMTQDELQHMWGCNDQIAALNMNRIQNMSTAHNMNDTLVFTPAILSYEGIQYQYMAPTVFENQMLDYVEEHLRILSAFYGVLRPMDGIIPYRLEMQAKLQIGNAKHLYEFWGDKIYEQVRDTSGVIINLASKEYSKCIETYLQPNDQMITCIFGEKVNGKVVQKGTYAKMARGEMVRFMAGHKIENSEELKSFSGLDYTYDRECSTTTEYVFVRKKKEN